MPRAPLVSVIVPTGGRPKRLLEMVGCFLSQTHARRELLILDDGPRPLRAAALRDPRIRYLHTRETRTIGAKRNELCALARGEIIAHFDDDDLYAPDYLAQMLSAMGRAELCKLSAWFALEEGPGRTWYWDTEAADTWRERDWEFVVGRGDPEPRWARPRERGLFLWGYGFSYVYRKDAWAASPFPDRSHGEDFEFVSALAVRGGRRVAVPDPSGLVLHVLHGANTSVIFPQYPVPEPVARKLFPRWLPRRAR